MTVQTTAWDEQSARAWLAGSWAPFAWALRGLALQRRPVAWHEGRDLPAGFRNLSASPAQCLADALRAAEQFPGLRLVIGFAFRDEQPDRGSPHVLCLAPADGLPVDPSVRLYGSDVAYLAAVPTVEHLRLLAASNGLAIPPWHRQ
jgi:hypothetical protein